MKTIRVKAKIMIDNPDFELVSEPGQARMGEVLLHPDEYQYEEKRGANTYLSEFLTIRLIPPPTSSKKGYYLGRSRGFESFYSIDQGTAIELKLKRTNFDKYFATVR